MSSRIILVHHHLRRGGVTRVMRHAVTALADSPVRCAILTGTPPEEDWPVPVGVVPELDYAESGRPPAAAELASALMAQARQLFDGHSPDLWHVHNHHLGKNPGFTAACAKLAADGHALLLQIHDFPEDGRPANYRHLRRCLPAEDLGATLYPTAARCHYAVLNRRDHDLLRAAGAAAERVHWLPNAVVGSPVGGVLPAAGSDLPLLLYPTRGIRRKNLGEMLLWAALRRGEVRFASTLVPENPGARPVYDVWRAFAREHDLPVGFGVGADPAVRFSDLVASATALLTTSMAEGFGLAFLEPWLMDRPLVGRNLPLITADFAHAGVALEHLYDALPTSLSWLDAAALRERMIAGYRHSLGAYGREVAPDVAAAAWQTWTAGGRIDFGRLDETAQREVILLMIKDHAVAAEHPCREGMMLPSRAVVAANRDAIGEEYGLERYGQRLLGIYRHLLEAPAATTTAIRPDEVLAGFLRPENFSLLRTL